MFQYADNFNCTCPEDRSTLYVNFVQTSPQFNLDGSTDSVKESVASIILDADSALALADSIQKLFNIDYLQNED